MKLNSDNIETQAQWAKKSWFESKVEDVEQEVSYFAHDKNGYQNFRHHLLTNIIASTIKTENATKINSILDVGCASGVLTNKIGIKFCAQRTVGIDFIESVLMKGRKNFPNIEFIEATLPNIPCDGFFDLIVASEVLYYLTDVARMEAISEFHGRLNSEGYLLLGSVLGSDYFTEESIQKILSKNFKIIAISTQHMKIYHMLMAPFFYSSRLLNLLETNSVPGSKKAKQKYNKYKVIVDSRFVRWILKVIVWSGKPILRSRRIPFIMNKIFAWTAATNVIIVAKKIN